MTITKEELLKQGIWVNDIENLAKKSKIVFEPPVRILNTVISNSGVIGAYTNIRGGVIRNLKTIGRFCNIAPGVTIGMGEHPLTYLSTHNFQYEKGFGFGFWEEAANFKTKTVPLPSKENPSIGNDVWIGANVTILKGVIIGDGAVIGAGSVVTKNVAPYEIVGGIPAKHIRFRFDPEIIERLLAIQWWEYTLDSLEGINFADIHEALKQLEERKAQGLLVARKRPRVKIVNREIVTNRQAKVKTSPKDTVLKSAGENEVLKTEQ